MKIAWILLKNTFLEWQKDRVPRLAAALSFYTVFSMAPLLVIAISIAAAAFGEAAARNEVYEQMEGLVGEEGARMMQLMIIKASESESGIWAAVLGIVTLIIGATTVLVQLQDALNTIWEVRPKPDRGILGTLRDRLLSFAFVVGAGFLLLTSLLVSAGLSALNNFLDVRIPGGYILWRILNLLFSFFIVVFIFAMIYKVIPDVIIRWRDVWVGAVGTAFLFVLGKFLIGFYLGNSSINSSYGAAGSLVILLLWVYYSSQIVFFGAEFTQVYARQLGTKIKPAKNAVAITNESKE